MKLNEIKDPVQEFLGKNEIKKYKINPDGTVDVDGDVKITTQQAKFPVKFGKVTGYFVCSNTQLTSLEGAPSYVGGNFYCSRNELTSLEGAPSYVGSDFSCSDNKLTSLHNIHKIVNEINGAFYYHYYNIKDSVLGLLLIKGVKRISLDNREVTKILNKHLGQGRAGVIGAQQELLDAGLDEYSKL